MKCLRRFTIVLPLLVASSFVEIANASDVQLLSGFNDLTIEATMAQEIEWCESEVAASELVPDSDVGWWEVVAFGALFTGQKFVEVAQAMNPLPNGLTRSRWAMDDPDYAKKYAEGAKKTDIVGKVKQASDARFQSGASGWYLSGGATTLSETDNPLASFEIGFEGYPSSYATYRLGFLGALNEGAGYVGGEIGCRLQTPTRLAPFLGAGTFAGFASQEVVADDDGIDNDDDQIVDERGEEYRRLSGALLGVYPESGIHFWWNSRVRLSVQGRYLITTEGRDGDSWLIGAGLALMSGQ